MKKLFLTLSLCIVLSAIAAATPTIYVVLPVYDFGAVTEGIAVTRTFVLRNTGDEVLEILGVNAECGCTATDLATDYIEPGESVDLKVLIDTAGFGGQTISKPITIYSTDPETPLLNLRVTGEVLEIEPHRIAVSDAHYFLYLLIDLRTAEEYDSYHFLGASNILLEELFDVLADLPRETMIILYDAAFEVSEDAALALRSDGFHSAYALVGGLNEWIHQYETRFITSTDEHYELPPRVSYAYEDGENKPSHYMHANDLDYLFYLYLDVRSVDEYAAGHIMGAVNIPFEELESWIDLLPKDVFMVTYDETGSLGDEAALWMINNGFASTRSMFGGLDEWIRQYGESYLFPSVSAQTAAKETAE